MAVTLYRCSARWVKMGGHPCWRVEKELIDAGIEYDVVPGPSLPWQRSQRTAVIEVSGQEKFPVIRFEDGSFYREESKAMAETIRAGRLFEKAGGGAAPASPDQADPPSAQADAEARADAPSSPQADAPAADMPSGDGGSVPPE